MGAHTYIHTYIHTDIQTYRHTDIQTYRHTDIQTYRHTDIQTYRHTDIQTYRHTDIQTYRHTDSGVVCSKQHATRHPRLPVIVCRSRVSFATFQRDCVRFVPIILAPLRRYDYIGVDGYDIVTYLSGGRRFQRLLSEFPSELVLAMRKHKLCNLGTLRSYPRTLSSGVLSVAASSWSTAPDNPTSTPMVGTIKASEPEDVEGLTCVAGRSGEGKRTHAMEDHDKTSSTAGDRDGEEGFTCVVEDDAESSMRSVKGAECVPAEGLMHSPVDRDGLIGFSFSCPSCHPEETSGKSRCKG